MHNYFCHIWCLQMSAAPASVHHYPYLNDWQISTLSMPAAFLPRLQVWPFKTEASDDTSYKVSSIPWPLHRRSHCLADDIYVEFTRPPCSLARKYQVLLE